MKHTPQALATLAVGLAALGLAATAHAQTTIISDTFTGGSGSINGKSPQVDTAGTKYVSQDGANGSVGTFQYGNTTSNGADGGVIGSTNNGSDLGIAFTAPTSGVLTFSANEFASKGSPVSLGFESAPGLYPYSSTNNNGTLYVQLTSNGSYKFIAPGFSKTGTYTDLNTSATPAADLVQIDYNFDTKLADLIINNVTLYSTTLASAPVINGAGANFAYQNFIYQGNPSYLDNLNITTVAPAAAPEPSGVAVMVLGLMGVGALAARKRRMA